MTYRTLKLALMVILMTVAPLGLAAEPLDKAELDTLRAALNVGGVEIHQRSNERNAGCGRGAIESRSASLLHLKG